MEEVWKSVIGYEGIYEISSIGNLKSLNRKIKHRTKKGFAIKKELILKSTNSNGYKLFILSKDGFSSSVSVHRLIAKAFIPNPKNKPQVNHINGIKTDNRVENLEWCTNSENVNHAINTGLIVLRKGEGSRNFKLTDSIVLEIRRLYESGSFTQKHLAHKYSVCKKTISNIICRKNWNHL